MQVLFSHVSPSQFHVICSGEATLRFHLWVAAHCLVHHCVYSICTCLGPNDSSLLVNPVLYRNLNISGSLSMTL